MLSFGSWWSSEPGIPFIILSSQAVVVLLIVALAYSTAMKLGLADDPRNPTCRMAKEKEI